MLKLCATCNAPFHDQNLVPGAISDMASRRSLFRTAVLPVAARPPEPTARLQALPPALPGVPRLVKPVSPSTVGRSLSTRRPFKPTQLQLYE